MSATEPDIKTYTHAIEMLKRRNVRLKFARAAGLAAIGVLLLAGEVRLAGLVALVLGGALLLIRDPLWTTRFCTAERFVLTDEQKRVRGILGIDEKYSTLRFFTESGQMMLDLSASSDFSSVLLAPESADECAHLSFATEHGPMLVLKSAFGQAKMGALRIPGGHEHLAEEWAPGMQISIKDANGRDRVFLSVESGELGATELGLVDGTGKAEVSAQADKEFGSFKVRDHDSWRTL